MSIMLPSPTTAPKIQNRAHHNDGVRADLRALADDGARLDARMQALEVQHGDGGVAGAVFHMQAVDVRGLRRKLRTERFPVAVEDMQAVPAGKNLRAGELAGRIGLQHHADGVFFSDVRMSSMSSVASIKLLLSADGALAADHLAPVQVTALQAEDEHLRRGEVRGHGHIVRVAQVQRLHDLLILPRGRCYSDR